MSSSGSQSGDEHTGTFKLQHTATMPAAKPPARAHVAWVGEHRFDAGRVGGGATSRIDASGKTGPGPVDMLLSALAACTAIDIVDILAKRKTPVNALTVDVMGERANAIPARVTKIHLTYTMIGEIERVHAERAIDLSVSKYCSVRNSLDPDMPIEWVLDLNGRRD